jgi:hypothetical protein
VNYVISRAKIIVTVALKAACKEYPDSDRCCIDSEDGTQHFVYKESSTAAVDNELSLDFTPYYKHVFIVNADFLDYANVIDESKLSTSSEQAKSFAHPLSNVLQKYGIQLHILNRSRSRIFSCLY